MQNNSQSNLSNKNSRLGKFILSIDQSTSGTKAMLFDGRGNLHSRHDLAHRQIVNDLGWVEHDPLEIYENTLKVVEKLIKESGISQEQIIGVGISNQRETAVCWDRTSGLPVYNAIVWQCCRGEEICKRLECEGKQDVVKAISGLPLSPYFSASKIAWVLENVEEAKKSSANKSLFCGTVDSWLVFKLTSCKSFKTDFSNASRTQLFDIYKLKWSEELCALFGILPDMLGEVCDSNSCFGATDFGGIFKTPIPIFGVIGDSHGALFGQGCISPGMIKTTYGTGSSIMMNIGKTAYRSQSGLATSLAWGIDGTVSYVLEGNINYTGAVIRWLVDDLKLISSSKEASEIAKTANAKDETYLVPAFSGLSAPYWDSKARAAIFGMSRTTGRAEIVRAAEECIAYQIADIINLMKQDAADLQINRICADGGPTKDGFLMQFQSDILNLTVSPAVTEESSGAGAAYLAGLSLGLYKLDVLFSQREHKVYSPAMLAETRQKKYDGWKNAVMKVLQNPQ